MINFRFLNIILVLGILISLNSCGFYKRSDVKDNPVNVNERVKKNIKEGRGIRFGKGATRGGDFDFASSNPLWRASIEIFDFVPLTLFKHSTNEANRPTYNSFTDMYHSYKTLPIADRELIVLHSLLYIFFCYLLRSNT